MSKKDLFAYVVSRKSSKPARSAKTVLKYIGMMFSTILGIIVLWMMVSGYDIVHPVRCTACVLLAVLPLAIWMGYTVLTEEVQ